MKKEKRSVRRIDGGIKAIVNDEGTKRNSDDEEVIDDQKSRNVVRLLQDKQQTANIKINSYDEETTDNQNSGHAVRILERQKRREKLQEEKEKRVTIVRCLFSFVLFVVRRKSTSYYVYIGPE